MNGGGGGGEATAKMVVERGGKEHKGSAMLVDLLVCKSKSVCVCVCVCEREREFSEPVANMCYAREPTYL